MKHVQYKGDIAYHVIKRNGEQTWTRLGPKDEAATWAIYETLERALVDSDEHFSAVADRFIKAMLDPKSPWKRSEKTKKEYSRQLRQGGRVMRVFGKMKISNIKPKHIAQFLDKHPSPVSANREAAVISQVCSHAIREGLIEVNPTIGVRRLPESKRRRYMTDQEFAAIREKATESVQIAMDLAYLTGLRLSDVLALRVENAKGGYLHSGEQKTGNCVRFELTPTLAAVIKRSGLNIGPIVHTHRNGRVDHYTVDGFESLWQRAKIEAGLRDVRFHDIRAKHATDRDEADLNAQLALGHTDGQMTKTYIRHQLGRVVRPLK